MGYDNLPPRALAVGKWPTAEEAGGSACKPTVKGSGVRHARALCPQLRILFTVGVQPFRQGPRR